MFITSLKQCLLILFIIASPYKSLTGSNITTEEIYFRELPEVIVKAKRPHRHSGSFLGFQLQQPMNTRIHSKLEEALKEFTGPKSKISSLRRFGTRSRHCCGKAVDFEWSHELIEYLVSPEGTAWREKYGFTFYIESTPRHSSLTPYKNDTNYSKYVFENPNATGPHIHLNL
jgi:hypothetical protein